MKRQQVNIEICAKYASIYEPATEVNPRKRYYLRKGGRASGKTYAFVTAAVARAVSGGEEILFLRKHHRSISESAHSFVGRRVVEMFLSARFSFHEATIRTDSGSVFMFEDALHPRKGWREATICFIDDAHTLTDHEWRGVLSALGDGVEVWAAWNGGFEEYQPAVFSRFVENLDPSTTDYEHTTYEDNQHLPQVVKDQIEYDKARNLELFRMVWLGEVSNG